MRAHITEVFVFLLSQVSQSLYKTLYINDLSEFQRYFNELSRISSAKRSTTSKNTDFRADFFSDISLIFPAFSLPFSPCFHSSVILVTAKKQHCGWNARAYACTRETLTEFSPSTIFLAFPSSLLGAWFNTLKYCICYFYIAYLPSFKEKNALFHDFFTLWGNIFPYTNRGMRCKPPSVQELMTCIEH